MPDTTDLQVPELRSKLWVQIVLVFVLAALTQVAGLVFAYATRCKPGQGNDFCGAGSLAAVVVGFVAALIVMIVGLVIVFLRRKRVDGARGPGAGRVVAAVFGAVVLVPCAWMIIGGWPRNNTDFVLWIGVVVGLALIAVALLRRRPRLTR